MIRLIIATYLWASVLALGTWDCYILWYPPCNLPQIYQEVLMPVVRITCPNGVGSGVVISLEPRAKSTYILTPCPEQIGTGAPVGRCRAASTFVLTAAHVVGDLSEVAIHIYDYESSIVTIEFASVVATDTVKDLALLRINGTRIKAGHRDIIFPAKLAPRNYKPQIFTPVYAVGCSLGLNPRPSSGIISVTSVPPWQMWEVSAPILPGNSGGGVFLKEACPNGTGRAHQLIGIVVWVRTCGGQLITTASGVVPIQQVYEFLEECDAKIPLGAGLRCPVVVRPPGMYHRSVYEFLSQLTFQQRGSVRKHSAVSMGPGRLIDVTTMKGGEK